MHSNETPSVISTYSSEGGYFETLKNDITVEELKIVEDLTVTPEVKKSGLGSFTAARMKTSVDWMAENGGFPKEKAPKPQDVYLTGFLPSKPIMLLKLRPQDAFGLTHALLLLPELRGILTRGEVEADVLGLEFVTLCDNADDRHAIAMPGVQTCTDLIQELHIRIDGGSNLFRLGEEQDGVGRTKIAGPHDGVNDANGGTAGVGPSAGPALRRFGECRRGARGRSSPAGRALGDRRSSASTSTTMAT